jgi:hypothetical protein
VIRPAARLCEAQYSKPAGAAAPKFRASHSIAKSGRPDGNARKSRLSTWIPKALETCAKPPYMASVCVCGLAGSARRGLEVRDTHLSWPIVDAGIFQPGC